MRLHRRPAWLRVLRNMPALLRLRVTPWRLVALVVEMVRWRSRTRGMAIASGGKG